MWQGWFDFIVGIWLVISGFIAAIRTPASMIVAGAAAVVFGFWGAGRSNSWQGTVNGILGIWLLLSAIWFNLAMPWNFFVSGAIIAILAIWNVAEHPETKHVTAH